MHLFILLSIFLFSGFNAKAEDVLTCENSIVMGTDFKICVYANKTQSLNVKIDFQKAFKKLREIDAWMSEWRPGTELSKVNEAAGAKPIKVSKKLFKLIKYALSVSRDSEGAFDPSFNAFWGLYKFKKGEEREPTDLEITERLSLINYKFIILNESEQTVFLKNPGMKLGLGGIGQGYAVDELAVFLKGRGYSAGFVDGSGDTYFWGKKPSGEFWTAGIRDPGNHQSTVAQIYGTDFAITTCGDDEKFFIKDGRRVHHIIDTKTGRPANQSRQISVISKKAIEADAWDTASFVLGPAKARPLLEKKGFEAVLIGPTGEVTFTKGLKKTKTKWGEVYTF